MNEEADNDPNLDPDAETDVPTDPDERRARPNKYKFKNFDRVMNIDNYDPLHEQDKKNYRYKDSKGTFLMNWAQRVLMLVLEEEVTNI